MYISKIQEYTQRVTPAVALKYSTPMLSGGSFLCTACQLARQEGRI